MNFPTRSAVVLAALLPLPLSALTLQDLSSPAGLPGATVTVTGVFEPTASHTVEIGGTSATVGVVTVDSLSFTVPVAASTGELTVTEDADSASLPLPFVILREITGTFTPPAGVTVTGYFAGTGEDVRAVLPDGSFTAVVEKGEPATVMLFKGENDPSYLTRLPSGDTAITTDAASTAFAMVVTNPLVKGRDDLLLAAQQSYLAGKPDFTALVSRINTLGNADYLDDGQVEDLLVSLVTDVRADVPDPVAASFKTGDDVATYGVKLRELNPDPADTVNPVIRHSKSLNSSVEGIGSEFVNFIYETDRDTRLDWTYSLNELDPFAFPGGIADIEALDVNDPATAPVPFGAPLEHGYVRATLDSAKLDYFGQAIGAATKAVYGLFTDKAPSDRTDRFVVERQPPGLYMITATSGNFWYGTDWLFLGTNNQEDSIAKSDPGYQWELSAGTNAFLAAADAVGIILSVKEIGNSDVRSIVFAVAKTISAYRDAGTPLTRAALLEISKKLVDTVAKGYVTGKAKDLPGKIGQLNLMAGRAVKTALKQIDILGKISSGLQALERGATLFSPGTLAMERAILVVGDPFAPVISGISPLRAREGERLVIAGSAFGTTTPTVNFCEFPSTIPPGEEPAPTGAPLAATVVETRDTRLVIEVPSGFLARFPNGEAHLCIEKSADSKTDSYALGEAGVFHFIDKPVVTAIDPSPEADGGVVVITGQNFIGLRPEVKVNGNRVGSSVISDTQLLVNLPALSTAGSHSLTVAFGDDISVPFNFTVTRPVHVVDPGLVGGASISVNELSMINAANDKLSVLEAFLIANGSLGRALTFDEDALVGGTPGAGRRDSITIFGSGQTIVLNQAIPVLDSGDTIRCNGLTFDGQSLAAGTDGLILDGVTDVRVTDLILTGFPGDGVRVTNGSNGNSLENLTISGSGENGLFIRNDCDFNNFDTVEILGSTLDGLNFADLCDHNTFTDLMIDGAGDDGAELDNGIDRNAFVGLTIANCLGDGLVITNGATQNRFTGDNEISMITGTGIVLDGDGVSHNGFQSDLFSAAAAYSVRTAVRDCGQYGVRIENGASANLLGIKFVSNCELGGVLIAGDTTTGNTVGRVYNRAITQGDEFTSPLLYSLVADCGPGSGTSVHGISVLDSPGNTLTGLNISGCDGDAIRLSGATCTGNRLLSIRTGLSDFIEGESPAAAPNSGVGLRITNGSSENRLASKVPVFIGTFGGGNLSYKHRNRIANDLLGGIVIENGSNDNEVLDLDIGGTEAADGEGATGGDGIAILSGSSYNLIGSADYYETVIINACPGAAIRVDGATTTGTILGGMRIGQIAHRGVDTSFADSRPNALGIVVSNGAPGTIVGVPAPLLNQPSPFSFFDPDPFSVNITGTAGAAVTLDAAGGGADPVRVNHVAVNESETGLRVTGGSSRNRIDFNRFSASGTAGIHIDANVIADAEADRNLYTRNSAISTATPSDVNLFDANPGACGLLISNGSSGNVVGEGIGRSNRLQGAIIDSSNGNWLRGNSINYYGPFNFGSPSSQVICLLLRDSAQNLIGGAGRGYGNEFGDPFYIPSGSGGSDSAGVAIDGGMNNTVQGNKLDYIAGNGVFINGSSSNLVGGGSLPEANTITRCLLNGVRIDESGSQNNHIQGNDIGTNFANANFGNTGDGVRIEGAASANVIGGLTTLAAGSGAFRSAFRPSLTAGNRVAFNGGDGVAVSGASSIGNPITLNSIHSNSGFGIGLPGGGNNNVSLSITGSFGSGVATGTVTDLASVPVGSTLHFYGDRSGQGEVYLTSTTVQAGGVWSAIYPVHPYANMNVTATTPDPGGFGDTTPFAPISAAAVASFTLDRAGGGPAGSRTDSFDVGKMVVAVLRASSSNGATQITGLTFEASGTVDDATGIDGLAIYLDQDGNGQLDATDPQLGDEAAFGADDGSVMLAPDSLVAPENGSVDFLVVCHAASPPAAGETFSVELTAAASVDANFVLPLGPAAPTNAFPVSSDLITLGTSTGGGGGQTFGAWQQVEFAGETDPMIIGEAADPDKDGVLNIFEFLFGTDPNDPASSARPLVTTGASTITFEFPQAKNLEGINPVLESSYELAVWETAFDAAVELLPGSPVDTVRYTLPRTSRVRFLRLNTAGTPGMTFDEWQAIEFPGESDALIIGENADPDFDGWWNIFEFLSGTDPDDPASRTGPTISVNATEVTVEMQRAKGITGVLVGLESSTDLMTWTPVTGANVEVIPGPTHDTLRFRIPRDGNTGYVRLTATVP
ncbi:fibronectin type III domain-containing protein [Haloferula helveola]|uniref:Probable pectate lyase C n=1 Tax=Haloferula helveola TaxID=490095 RepID=A0ABN6GZX6_9BACT|nr:fibronectin type III domain-containing protein [Haloferula helveola]